MTSAEAIQLALETGEPHRTHAFFTTATSETPSLLKLKLTRMIGAAERSHETHATFSEGCDAIMFRQQCARAWQWLADEHRRGRQETGI